MDQAATIEVVYGPPGTGKTSYLLEKMASCGYEPKHVGFFSFTRAAANVALDRLNLRSSDTIRTLHSMAFRLADASKAQMVDADKLQELAKLTGYPFSGKDEWPEDGDLMLGVHHFARAACLPLEEAYRVMKPDFPFSIVSFVSRTYEKWTRSMGYLDFNVLLERAIERGDIKALGLQALFIDEAQDLSPLQWKLVLRFVEEVPHVWLAGDDDQSLYLWAGSMRHGMRAFHGRAQVKVLGKSWRIPVEVHRYADAIISQVHDRVSKEYASREEQGEVKFWGDIRYVDLPKDEDTLILYRNHAMREELENWLIEHRVPYKASGHFPSIFYGLQAAAIRAWKTLQRNEVITMGQWRALVRAVGPFYKKAFTERAFDQYLKLPWDHIIYVNDPIKLSYLREVDLDAKCHVSMSTIHASKGMEADRVILCLGMGDKTSEGFDDDEHRVFYVGATRAKRRLDVIDGPNAYPFPRLHGGSDGAVKAS